MHQNYADTGCCAINTIVSLPWDNATTGRLSKQAVKVFKDELTSCTNAAKKAGKSILMATCATGQNHAAELLEEEGFVSVFPEWTYRDMTISNYKTGVKIFVKQIVDQSSPNCAKPAAE